MGAGRAGPCKGGICQHVLPIPRDLGCSGAGSPFPIPAMRVAYSFFPQGPEADPNPSGSGNWIIPTSVLCLAFGDGVKLSEQPHGDIG